jgi:membrane protein DedA with SNARE-associated domain
MPLLAVLVVAMLAPEQVQSLLEQYFYAGLLGILVIASLGLPIPEDVPLIAAGVVLRLHPDTASWPLTLLTALVGIMSGDLVLYSIGRFWGRDVVKHKSVQWIITPERFAKAEAYFRRWGVWFCFFGRFIMGIRAVMCMVAGATHFPYWRFFLADFAGALLSVPLFVGLGYAFANALKELMSALAEVHGAAIIVVVLGVAAFAFWEFRRFRKHSSSAESATAGGESAASPDAGTEFSAPTATSDPHRITGGPGTPVD